MNQLNFINELNNMKKAIKQRIKELYKSIALFCAENNYRYTDFGSKLKTMENKYNSLNEFLEPLNMEVIIKEKENEK